MRVTGLYPDRQLVEIVELADHPWFLGTQFHAEYRSRPNRPHPLYREFIAASLAHARARRAAAAPERSAPGLVANGEAPAAAGAQEEEPVPGA